MSTRRTVGTLLPNELAAFARINMLRTAAEQSMQAMISATYALHAQQMAEAAAAQLALFKRVHDRVPESNEPEVQVDHTTGELFVEATDAAPAGEHLKLADEAGVPHGAGAQRETAPAS